MNIFKRLFKMLFKNELESRRYYKEDEDPIRRSLTHKLGRTYIASTIINSKKE